MVFSRPVNDIFNCYKFNHKKAKLPIDILERSLYNVQLGINSFKSAVASVAASNTQAHQRFRKIGVTHPL